MDCWSPQDAMKAYLQSLHLVNNSNYQDSNGSLSNTRGFLEPKCVEFISALAAGHRAKLMVEITSQGGVTPLTIALAVAAKHTGGRVFCVVLNQRDFEKSNAVLRDHNLDDVVEIVDGNINPCEVIKRFKGVDFVIIDCKFEDHLKLLESVDVNPSGSIVVQNNVVCGRSDGVSSFAEVVKGKRGVEFVTLPIGEGMEVTRIRSSGKLKSRRFKRFLVTFE